MRLLRASSHEQNVRFETFKVRVFSGLIELLLSCAMVELKRTYMPSGRGPRSWPQSRIISQR